MITFLVMFYQAKRKIIQNEIISLLNETYTTHEYLTVLEIGLRKLFCLPSSNIPLTFQSGFQSLCLPVDNDIRKTEQKMNKPFFEIKFRTKKKTLVINSHRKTCGTDPRIGAILDHRSAVQLFYHGLNIALNTCYYCLLIEEVQTECYACPCSTIEAMQMSKFHACWKLHTYHIESKIIIYVAWP